MCICSLDIIVRATFFTQKPVHVNGTECRSSSSNCLAGTLTFEECNKLQIGDLIDHRDHGGKWSLASIIDKVHYKLKIHYIGMNVIRGVIINYNQKNSQIQKALVVHQIQD